MSVGTGPGTNGRGARVPWADVALSAVAAVSWALTGMAATAALGLHLLRADAAGALGPMTAAVVALGAGGSVTPSADVSAFGLHGAQAHTALGITPLGVSLVGALLLAWCFLRSVRRAGLVIAPAELLARAGTVVAVFTAGLGTVAWVGHGTVTVDAGRFLPDRLPGTGGVTVPGLGDLGDLGDLGGLLPGLGRIAGAKVSLAFRAEQAPTLLGALGWSAGVLLIALLASRRTPLPRGLGALHRVVRPAVSALAGAGLVAVVAGLAAAAYAAAGDARPGRIAGAALLGAPNGVWVGLPVGLLVPWDGRAAGAPAGLLPAPLGRLLTVRTDRPVTLPRLAELDGRVWLLGVAAALLMLLAGVLTAVRTPVPGRVLTAARTPLPGRTATVRAAGADRSAVRAAAAGRWATGGSGAAAPAGAGARDAVPGGSRGSAALGLAGWCALRLGVATAVALPLLGRLTRVSVGASLSLLGVDAVDAGIELHGHPGAALLLGAVWGAGAGAAGALLAHAAGAAGRRATPWARGAGSPRAEGMAGGAGAAAPAGASGARGEVAGGPADEWAGTAGGSAGAAGARGAAEGPAGAAAGAGEVQGGAAGAAGGWPGAVGTRSGAGDAAGGAAGTAAWSAAAAAAAGPRPDAGTEAPGAGARPSPGAEGDGGAGRGSVGAAGPGTPYPSYGGDGTGPAGPYTPGRPHRPPNPATNPYLRLPAGLREPEPEPEDARPPVADRTRADGIPDRSGKEHSPGDGPEADDTGAGRSGAGGCGHGDRGQDGPGPGRSGKGGGSGDDVSGAPTVMAPLPPPPPRRPRPREWPPPPPPPPPPRAPKNRP
ncbi:streptophobe family protein [Streptomyces tropicalis]|uniref:Streptophobe family protein n=1 Tax=Streptomyces tropicalis TaxID=3034234 RepID=A0ABT6AC48_9ACTN|nr:streptophobe family protein [Streptomyces tropicalis]MDF3302232.1 streptophobe family protein [Streptomyces tropicalis]